MDTLESVVEQRLKEKIPEASLEQLMMLEANLYDRKILEERYRKTWQWFFEASNIVLEIIRGCLLPK